MTIEVWQDKRLGERFAVEVDASGRPVQAMLLNGKRDEEYVVSHPQFGEDYTLTALREEPRRYFATARTLQPAAAAPVAVATPADDEWTYRVTSDRLASFRVAIRNPANLTDGKPDAVKVRAAVGFSLKALKAARDRHGL